MIATKIRDGEYKDLNDVEEDLIRMCRNAQSFNEPGSQIYKVCGDMVIFVCILPYKNYLYRQIVIIFIFFQLIIKPLLNLDTFRMHEQL